MRYFITVLLIFRLTTSSDPENAPLCPPNCSCQLSGPDVSRAEHVFRNGFNRIEISDSMKERFVNMSNDIFPLLHSDFPEGEALRESCPFLCSRGKPSKTRVIDIFGSVEDFVSLEHCKYSRLFQLEPASPALFNSIRTLIEISRSYGSDCMSIYRWPSEISFSESEFYKLFKNVSIIDDPVIRAWYARRSAIESLKGKIQIPGDLMDQIFSGPTLASEFPQVDFLFRVQNRLNRHYQREFVEKFIRYAFIAIDTVRQSPSKDLITSEMIHELMGFIDYIMFHPSSQRLLRRRSFQYSPLNPVAMELNEILSTLYDEMRVSQNLPLYDWNQVGDVASLLASLDPAKHAVVCQLLSMVPSIEYQCGTLSEDAADPTSMMNEIVWMLQIVPMEHLGTLVSILLQVDLPFIMLEAGKLGYYLPIRSQGLTRDIVQRFMRHGIDWMHTVFTAGGYHNCY